MGSPPGVRPLVEVGTHQEKDRNQGVAEIHHPVEVGTRRLEAEGSPRVEVGTRRRVEESHQVAVGSRLRVEAHRRAG